MALAGWIGRVASGLLRLKQRLDPSSLPDLVVGDRVEWQDFARRHREFFARFRSLKAVVNKAFEGSIPDPKQADIVILLLARICGEDFQEVLLLSANGYGFGATKLLRGMYERLVAARYLHLHPEEADNFLAWGVVDTGKRSQAILETFRDELDANTVEKLKELIAEGKSERDKFMVACSKCGAERLGHSWSKLDFVSMAKAVDSDTHTPRWIVPCYLEPTRHAHANASALEPRFSVSAEAVTFVGGPSRKEADNALMFAHVLILDVCELLLRHFEEPGLDLALKQATDDYVKVWGSDTASA